MSIIELQPIEEKKAEEKEIFYTEYAFPEKIDSICIQGNCVVVLGDPPHEYESDKEETWHNCDAMGCGQQHVLMRIYGDNLDEFTDVTTRQKNHYK